MAGLYAKVGRKTTRTRAVKSEDGQKHKWTWQAEAGGPYSANRLLALVCTLFNYAATQGYEGANPTKDVKRFKEQSRDRFLHPDEIPAFFAALGDAQTPDLWRDFLTAALLTGARRANVMSMT